jgi:hypothetical protein
VLIKSGRDVGAALASELERDVDYAPVDSGGATRAASLVAGVI